MKNILMVFLTLISHNIYATVMSDRVLVCTFTRLNFGAKPEITKVFRFVEKPGYLPLAQGVFFIPSENTAVNVSANLIYVNEEKSEYVKTSITLRSKQMSVSAGFSNRIQEQSSILQLNNSGIILCKTN